MELLRETAEACTLILDHTHWQIRLLSKGNLLPLLVKREMIPNRQKAGNARPHHQRIIFGFSTGTLDDRLAAAFEKGTARVSKRLEALYWLQDHGYRTFAMICPSLPQSDYVSWSRQMCEALRVERCEHVWAEVINVRVDNFKRTYEALVEAGFCEQAELLASVREGKNAGAKWEAYARQTFEAHTLHVPGDKLRFLQYIHKHSAAYWKAQGDKGALLLGSCAQELCLAKIVASAPGDFYQRA